MKNISKTAISSIIIILTGYVAYAQPPDCVPDIIISKTVRTPAGNLVPNADYYSELSSNDRSLLDDYYINTLNHPSADPISLPSSYGAYYSSSRFNCHGYAWHMVNEADETDWTDPVWIGTTQYTLEYVEDGISYKQVATPEYPGWVLWSSAAHTARTTPDPDRWISKWACGPIMEHDTDDHPYAPTGMTYYKLCYKRQFEDNILEDDTLSVCKHELEDCSVAANVDLEIVYEDWLKITGTFNTGSGATLSFYPEN